MTTSNVIPRRQRVRQAILLFSLLVFPLTIYYFSPYIIVDGAAQGIISGSMIVFALMFLSSLLVGRLWCGWLCPAGGLQAACARVNNKRSAGGRWNWVKWGIWIPWMVVIIFLAVRAGGFRTLNPFHNLEGGVAIAQPHWYAIYYIIVGLFVLLALLFGRQAACHYICWMAPFMILGRKIRNALAWPSLRLKADPEQCTSCQKCTRDCPMSLDVHAMVQASNMENSECILCGTCVDHCPNHAIRFTFSGGQ